MNLSDITTQLFISRTLALALPNFYKKTNISASFTFSYDPEQQGLIISLGFLPKEPTKEEYSTLFEEIVDAETLLINDYVLNLSNDFENLNQLIFKHKESTKKIIEKVRSQK